MTDDEQARAEWTDAVRAAKKFAAADGTLRRGQRPGQPTLTVSQAASRLGVPEAAVRAAINAKRLPSTRTPQGHMVTEDDARNFWGQPLADGCAEAEDE